MKILITGGAGFIGSNFVKYILKKYKNYEVKVLDLLTYAGNLDNLLEVKNNKKFCFYIGDVRDKEKVLKIMRNVDAVVHFAAETHVDRSILSSDAFITTDVYGTYVLLEAARNSKIKKFLHISTDEVYGEAKGKPCSEDSPLFPKSPYAASKAGADRIAYSYYVTYNLPVIITRCTNNYGPNQYPEKMIPLFITNALEDKFLPVYGDGKNKRDWIYTTDHCKALDILLHSNGFEGEIFNIGSGEEFSVIEVANIILDNLGKSRNLIKFVLDRPGHVRRHAVRVDKLRKLTKWKPEIKFEDGIKNTIKWYIENKWWWEKIKNKQKEYRNFYKIWYNKRK